MLTRLAELPLLVVLVGLAGGLALLPAIFAVASDQTALGRDFLWSGLVILIGTVMLGIATAAFHPRNLARSHLAALVGAYVVLPPVMALPLTEAVPGTTFVNAWFEMVSAFTTTGATVYDPGRLPDAVHLWRALVGWFGGFVTLLAATAILAPLNLGGSEVATGRVPGRGAIGALQSMRTTDPADRLARMALQLLPIYATLTLVLWVGLMLAGEAGINALILAMGTLSTSGISGASPIANGIPAEVLIFAFFIFATTRSAIPTGGVPRALRRLRDDPEFRLAILILACVTLTLFLRHASAAPAQDAGQALAALWGILFTAASFLTTTGYLSADWQSATDWSGLGSPGLVLLALAIIGGGTATVAGGVRLLRVYALLRHGERELDRIIHPNSVGHGDMEARRLRREGAQIAWVFFMLFGISIAVTVGLLTLAGLEFEPAQVLAVAALTTTGPLASVGMADPIVYAELSPAVQSILGLAMIVGRLETLALLALILPGRGRP